MMDWWRTREPREQLLISIGAAVFAFVVLIQFLVIPILSGRAEARLAHDAEARALDTLVAELAARPVALASGSSQAQSTLSADAMRTAVTALARDKGLSVARVQSGAGGRISIAMDSADPKLVFNWLTECRAQFGVKVSRATLSQGGEDTVRAAIEFEGAR